jgi:hypothetical protein
VIKKIFILLAFFLCLGAFKVARASDIYFAATSAGANNGTSCSNAYAYNDATHGINKAVNWVPGNTLHICGTISVSAGANAISCQANGTSSVIGSSNGTIAAGSKILTSSSAPFTSAMVGYPIVLSNAGAGGSSLIRLIASYQSANQVTLNDIVYATTSTSTMTWGSGAITVKWEAGAIVNAPYFGSGGTAGVSCSNTSWVVFNGGNTGSATGSSYPNPPTLWTGGIIQNYANGTSGKNNCPGIANTGTGACSNQVASNTHVFEATGMNNAVFENFGPCVSAVVTGGAFGNGAPGVDCMRVQGSNVLITNNQFVNDGTGIDDNTYGNDNDFEISGNWFQTCGWGIVTAGGAVSATNFYEHDNWMGGDWTEWNGTGAHLNGTYAYNGSGGGIASLYFYNNVFYGTTGGNGSGWTAWAHFGNDSAPAGHSWTNGAGLQAWNNVCVVAYTSNNGCIEDNGGSANNFYNNTFIQTAPTGLADGAGCAVQGGNGGGSGLSQGVNFQGNVIQGYASAYCFDSGVSSFTASKNIYAQQGSGGGDYFTWTSGTSANTLSTWQANCSCDSGSTSQFGSALADLTNYGAVSTGFPGLLQGGNLTSTGTGARASLLVSTTFGNTSTGEARPSGSTAWDLGAEEISNGGSGSIILSPSSQNFGSVDTGSSSSPVTFTLTNNSSTTATSINPTTTSGNSGDFTITNSGAGSCSAAGNSIAASASCTFTVTFSPTAGGSRSTTLSVSYGGGDSASPQTSALSGTGVVGAVTLSPSSKNFGSINVGSSSSPTTFTLTNNNSATATSINPTTTGGNSGDFTIVNSGAGSCNAAGNSLANGASCTFTVTFSPTATGSRSTTLSVSYSGADGASPRTAALSGTGTSAAATGTTISGAAQMIGNNAKIQ